jgi:hypothetical protein
VSVSLPAASQVLSPIAQSTTIGSPPVVRFVEIQRNGVTRQESEIRGIHEHCEDAGTNGVDI